VSRETFVDLVCRTLDAPAAGTAEQATIPNRPLRVDGLGALGRCAGPAAAATARSPRPRRSRRPSGHQLYAANTNTVQQTWKLLLNACQRDRPERRAVPPDAHTFLRPRLAWGPPSRTRCLVWGT